MKKIIFLNPPLTLKERSGNLSAAAARAIPYGLLSLATVTKNAGYETTLLDATNHGYSCEETIELILKANPDYLGISTVTLSIHTSAALTEELKKKNKDNKVIVGGAHISSAADETMKLFPSFDVGVIGEGEETILELLAAFDQNKPLSTVRGIIYKDGPNIVKTDRRPFIKNLDVLPLPAWDLLHDMTNFYRPSAPSYVRLPATTIVTSRGCPGNCIFCNSKAIFGGLRCFSADYVIRLIQDLTANHGIKDISIYDDNFIFFRERVERICHFIIENKIDLTWSCYSRVDQGDTELFKLMKRAGCWQISYGIESGSQKILNLIRKNVTLERIESTIRATKKAGLRTRGFFIIGHFDETEGTIQETISFMKKIPLDDFHFTTFTPLPGTEAYHIADTYGTFDRTWSKLNLQYPAFIPKGLTPEIIETYSKKAYFSFYFRPRIIASYIGIVFKYPENMKRLLNGLKALLLRIFSQ